MFIVFFLFIPHSAADRKSRTFLTWEGWHQDEEDDVQQLRASAGLVLQKTEGFHGHGESPIAGLC